MFGCGSRPDLSTGEKEGPGSFLQVANKVKCHYKQWEGLALGTQLTLSRCINSHEGNIAQRGDPVTLEQSLLPQYLNLSPFPFEDFLSGLLGFPLLEAHLGSR